MNDQAMREKKLREAANDLHAAFCVMNRDWNDGDFDLPPLARIHMETMEGKAVELGKLLFRQNDSAETHHPSAKEDSEGDENK